MTTQVQDRSKRDARTEMKMKEYSDFVAKLILVFLCLLISIDIFISFHNCLATLFNELALSNFSQIILGGIFFIIIFGAISLAALRFVEYLEENQ